MKFEDLVLAEWDKSFSVVADLGSFDIRQLRLVKISTLNTAGRPNLVAVDKNNNIKWIAEPPAGDNGYGYFNHFAYKGGKLKGWYGGSIFLEIDAQTGKVMHEGSVA